MKKSLIALAVMAAAGAASAQSSVTVYGIVDAHVGTCKNSLGATSYSCVSDATTSVAKQTGVNSGGLSTSRWGLKGSEDLGGGMKAVFQLEQAIKVDTGDAGTAGVQFDRQAWVGVSGDFGLVQLGKNWGPFDQFHDAVNAVGNLNMSPTDAVNAAAGGDYTTNLSNLVAYTSPTVGGFSGSIGMKFGEDKTTTTGANDTLSLYVKYANGPLMVGYAYQNQEAVAGDTTFSLIGATYDFGSFKLVGSYTTVDRDSNPTLNQDTEYQFGVSAPVGPVTLYFGYANAESENTAGVKQEQADGFALVATYPLSKRTDLYAAYKSVTKENGSGVEMGELKQVAFGVRHSF